MCVPSTGVSPSGTDCSSVSLRRVIAPASNPAPAWSPLSVGRQVLPGPCSSSLHGLQGDSPDARKAFSKCCGARQLSPLAHFYSSPPGTGVRKEEFLLWEGARSQNILIKPLERTFYSSDLSSFCFVAPSLMLMSPLESH